MKKIGLLLIDPQVDFCDPNGALYVKGAERDMDNVAALIDGLVRKKKLADCHVTLDCHQGIHVAHPIFWIDASGNHPAPFTLIAHQDVVDHKWTAARPSLRKHVLAYTKALQDHGRYPLVIWPPHCLIGSGGNNVAPKVLSAVRGWSDSVFNTIHFVSKGSNPLTEHYSAVQADVPDANDPSTQINTTFIRNLEEADELLLAGEAGSHCLANTVRDVVDNLTDPDIVKKFVLLTDCTSPVPSFEKLQDDFIRDMQVRGVRVMTSKDYLAAV